MEIKSSNNTRQITIAIIKALITDIDGKEAATEILKLRKTIARTECSIATCEKRLSQYSDRAVQGPLECREKIERYLAGM